MVNFDVSGTATGIINALYYFVIIGAAALVVLAFLFIKKYKHKIRLRYLSNTGKRVYDDKFREFKDKDGNIWYKTLKKNLKLPVAPSTSIDTDMKGRMVIEAYILGTGEVVYCKDNALPKEIPENIKKIIDVFERQKKTIEWAEKENAIANFNPLTTPQRNILLSEIRKAEARKKKGLWDSLPQVVGMAGIVILVICLMVFWGDLAKPVLDMKDKQIQHDQVILQIAQEVHDMKLDIQTIKEDVQGQNKGAPPG